MIDTRTAMRRHTAGLLVALVAACAVVSSSHAAEDQAARSDEFSQANRLLFMTDHMRNVDVPAKLSYSFTRSGDANDSYEDHVDLDVAEGERDGKRVKVDFLTGDRHRYVPDVGNAHGNPVIMMFLQNEVSTLAERTGGSWRYFQRRMKFALEDDATVDEDKARYDGHEIKVQRVSMQPFIAEKAHRNALGKATEKRYVFTLSDEVPGGVLEMRSETPAQDETHEATVERLALESVKRATHDPSTGS